MKMERPLIFVKKKFKIHIGETKNIVKLEIIVIIKDNIEELCIAYVIQNAVSLKRFL